MSLDAELCGDRRIRGLARKLVRRIDGEGPLPSEIEVPATPEEWEVIAEEAILLKKVFVAHDWSPTLMWSKC